MNKLASIALAALASCVATHHGTAVAGDTPPAKPRCGPGGPPGARCGPPATTATQPAPPPPALPVSAELVHPSVHTVVTTTIGTDVVRAVAGRGATGAFVTLETLANDHVAARTPITFDGVRDTSQLDVIQLLWRKDKRGALVFHLGANIGGWICHLDHGKTAAQCVIARGGGRPSK